MKTFFTILLATLCAATSYGQTMKALSYNASNGVVAYSGTNDLQLPSAVKFGGDTRIISSIFQFGGVDRISLEETRFVGDWTFAGTITFEAAASVRTNLDLGATWLTNANVTNFRTAIGLGATNNAAFRGLTSDGNIVITNQSATNNGLLFVYRTNNEAFLGLANLIASNNTTISNETLFRVGTAEATNRSAQFGFRSTNTNGSGVAVFSVFGYNALMQIGADASTNAVIFSGGGTNNQVMTLIKSGATEFARPISFANTTDAATTRTNLGLPLAALTNTSNVTTMRALAGSTNTNQPYSGTFDFQDFSDNTVRLTITNGIILNIEFP
jgi:hypothetical protein